MKTSNLQESKTAEKLPGDQRNDDRGFKNTSQPRKEFVMKTSIVNNPVDQNQSAVKQDGIAVPADTNTPFAHALGAVELPAQNIKHQIENYLSSVEPASENDRNLHLYCTVSKMQTDFGLRGEELTEWLYIVNQQKCLPPLSDEEVQTVARSFEIDEILNELNEEAPDTEPAIQQDITVPEKTGIAVLDSLLEQVDPVSFSELTEDKPKQSTYYIGSVDYLLRTAKKHQWDIGIKNESPHFFTGEYWKRIEQDQFRHFLQVAGMKQGIPYGIIKDHKFADNLMKQFASEARSLVLTASDTPKINLRNGTLHFTPSGTELKSFDKQDGMTYRLNYDFDETATAPLFKIFLDRVIPDVAVQKLIFQYIGYVFLRSMNLEKILFFYGGGANGKSVLLNIIRGLIGGEQCCEFSLAGLTGTGTADYQRAELGNYLLNVCTEISTRMGTDIFKKIASREPLSARYPYVKPFMVREYATSIFAMNELPRDVEQTSAFFRRFLIIPFEVRIPEEEQDPELAQKILASEMSGVLNLVIEGVQFLLAEGKFGIPEAVQKAVESFQQESDSVSTYLVENDYVSDMDYYIPLRDMYMDYKKQCSAYGHQPVAIRNFSKRLRNLGYEVRKYGRKNQTVVFAVREHERRRRNEAVVPT